MGNCIPGKTNDACCPPVSTSTRRTAPRTLPVSLFDTDLRGFFDTFFNDRWQPWPSNSTNSTRFDFTPAVDIRESDAAYSLSFELPGVKSEDVTIEVVDGKLHITGEKKVDCCSETETSRHTGRTYGSFTKTYSLPDTVEGEGIEATFDSGVLKVTLPKAEEVASKARKIKIN